MPGDTDDDNTCAGEWTLGQASGDTAVISCWVHSVGSGRKISPSPPFGHLSRWEEAKSTSIIVSPVGEKRSCRRLRHPA